MKRTFRIILAMLLVVAFVSGMEFRLKLSGDLVRRVRYPELAELASYRTFPQMSQYMKSLAKKKGPLYAFDVLRLADLPPNMDVHLLGHTIGDILYRQKGIQGIYDCTQDFRNACSHSIVVGLYLEKGDAALKTIADICRKAPGGKGAYTMCFHGLGHGILAAVDYNLPKSIALCTKTKTEAYNFREEPECIGGAIMEILSGGSHNPGLWAVEQKKYFRDDDPLYPCTADFMPESARIICYDYLTPRLIEFAGMDFGNPVVSEYPKAFALCDRISAIDVVYRESCYGGFGKEFVALAQERDFRKINDMNDETLNKIHEWCNFAGKREGIIACVNHAVNSLYWGGENDFRVTVRFCAFATDPMVRSACFDNFLYNVSYYSDDSGYKNTVCRALPQTYVQHCQAVLQKNI